MTQSGIAGLGLSPFNEVVRVDTMPVSQPSGGGAVRRRDFMSLLGGAAAIPFGARAQQEQRMRTIGVLLPATSDDPVFQARLAAFHQELALLGWIIGRNVRIETRWATINPAEIRRHVAELVAIPPDVILSTGDSPCRRCYRRPAPYQSCFQLPPIPLAPATLIAWRGRVETSPGSCFTNTV